MPVTHPFWRKIEGVKELGVTVGCNPPASTLYCPGTKVKRALLATFLARALDIDHLTASKDYLTDDNGIVHENNISLLRDRGIVKGCGGTAFCPWAAVKRKDMARWVVRAFNLWQGVPQADQPLAGNSHPPANANKVTNV